MRVTFPYGDFAGHGNLRAQHRRRILREHYVAQLTKCLLPCGRWSWSAAARKLSVPEPGPGELLLKVRACGVCRTDLHVQDGEFTGGKLPVIPGHEIVGSVVSWAPE